MTHLLVTTRARKMFLNSSTSSSSLSGFTMVDLEEVARNSTNATSGDYSYSTRPETYIVPILFALIFIVGLLGNGTLVKIFASHASMRSRANSFVICLASGDLLVMLGSVPFTSLIYTFDSWPFGLIACKASEFFRDLSTGVTIFSLTMLSVDRYSAVSSPTVTTLYHEYGSGRRRITSRTRAVIAAVWTLSAALATPGAVFSFLLEVAVSDDRSILVCYPFPESLGPLYPKLLVTFKFVTYYAAPIIVIAIYYFLIAWTLLREPSINVSSGIVLTKAEGLRRQKRVKVVKMVLVLVTLFAICYLPSHIFLLWFYYSFPGSLSNYNALWHALKITGYVLAFSNSCLNPVILYFISKKYRMYFRKYLLRCCYPQTEIVSSSARLVNGPGVLRTNCALARKPKIKMGSREGLTYKFHGQGTFTSGTTTRL